MRRWLHRALALRHFPHYYRALATVTSRGVPLVWAYRIRLAWAYAKMAEPYLRVKR